MKSEEYKQACLQMWLWLRDNPSLEKHDFFRSLGDAGAEKYVGRFGGCATCAYCNGDCDNCPIDWPSGNLPWKFCLDRTSPYRKWQSTKTLGARKVWATEMVKIILRTWRTDTTNQ